MGGSAGVLSANEAARIPRAERRRLHAPAVRIARDEATAGDNNKGNTCNLLYTHGHQLGNALAMRPHPMATAPSLTGTMVSVHMRRARISCILGRLTVDGVRGALHAARALG